MDSDRGLIAVGLSKRAPRLSHTSGALSSPDRLPSPAAWPQSVHKELPKPPGEAHLRTIAMPRDANPNGDIFGG
jgi:hypothetical protein